MKPDLKEIKLLNGVSAAEWLLTQPEKYRSVATSAIYECLNRKWPLVGISIQMIAREIIREGRTEN